MNFRISALAPEHFQHLFLLDDAALARHNAVRQIVKSKPGSPCRVSFADADIGEEVLLLHYTHQPAASPFHASHAIYVRPHAKQAFPERDEVPAMLQLRTISVRGFDDADMMIDADLAPGTELAACITRLLGNDAVQYLHLHFAKPGCYAARVDRVEP